MTHFQIIVSTKPGSDVFFFFKHLSRSQPIVSMM